MMRRSPGRPPGTPKTGGRKKGSNMAATLRDEFERKGINLVQEAWDAIQKVVDPDKKAQLMISLMHFIFPRPRQDVSINFETMTEEQKIAHAKEVLGHLKEDRETINSGALGSGIGEKSPDFLD